MSDKTKKRIITVKEGEEVLYHGEDKRYYDKDYPRCALGIPLLEWFKFGSMIVVAAVFFINLNSGQIKIMETMSSVQTYMQSSDNWNSSFFGTPFKGGCPLDGSFRKHYLNKGVVDE